MTKDQLLKACREANLPKETISMIDAHSHQLVIELNAVIAEDALQGAKSTEEGGNETED